MPSGLLEASKDHLVTVAHGAPPGFSAFVAYWMQELPRDYRKALSHLGVVRRFPGSPVGWSEDGVEGFDPGNLIYSRALHLVAISAVWRFQWNMETQGDILEGMLAFFGRRAVCSDHHFRMHEFLQDLCKTVWQVSAHGRDFHSAPVPWLCGLGFEVGTFPAPTRNPQDHSPRPPPARPAAEFGEPEKEPPVQEPPAQEPVQAAPILERAAFKVISVFDSDRLGARFLSVAPGDLVYKLHPREGWLFEEPLEGYLFVQRVDTELRGWIPHGSVDHSALKLEEY